MTTKQGMLDGKGTVEDFNKSKRMFEALAEMLFKPRSIIGHPSWKDSITKEQVKRIEIERMKQIADADGEKIDEATDYEALIYVMTFSLSEPLGRTAQKIYYHLFKKFFPEKSDFIPNYEAEAIKDDLLAQRELIRLKKWLYKKSKQ